MGSVNKVILVGNLGRDAELRYTPGGAPVATINLATTEVWNDKSGQRQERTEWHRVVLWGKTAESLNEYLTKGKQIYVEGRLQTRQWDDKDGNKRYTTEIRGDRIVVWGKAAEALQEYLVKGKQIYVEGRLQTRQWDDKDGNKRYTTEIKADRVTLLGGGFSDEDSDDDESEASAASRQMDDFDIPF